MWGLDAYERTARLIPALLVLAPSAAALWGLWGSWQISTPLLLILLLVLSVPLAEWTRKQGRKKQDSLWSNWGGSPLAIALRQPSAAHLEEFRHRALSRLNHLYAEETPTGGSEDYELIAALAASYAREGGSQTVFPENVSYGFARNSYGVRPVGIAIAGATLLLLVIVFLADLSSNTAGLIMALSVSASTLCWWLFGVNKGRVRDAGDRYATAVIRWLASEPTMK